VALDVYYKQDLYNALRAAYAANEGPATLVAEMLEDKELQDIPLDVLLRIYRRGFHAALGVIALAFGLDELERGPQGRVSVEPHHSPSLRQGQAESTPGELDLVSLLWARARVEKQTR
jgi:hypothetical protein